jgi:transposase
VAEYHFVRQSTAYSPVIRPRTDRCCYADGKGSTFVDPEVFFRMWLVAYFNGISKDRHRCEEVRYNAAYRWFCRLRRSDAVPDHSSHTRIRDRLGERVFEAVFRRIVSQCPEKRVVKEHCWVMTDATLIAADGSLDSLIHNDPEQARIEAESQRRGSSLLDPSVNRHVSNQTYRSRTDPRCHIDPKARYCPIRRSTPRAASFSILKSLWAGGTKTSLIWSSCDASRIGAIVSHSVM